MDYKIYKDVWNNHDIYDLTYKNREIEQVGNFKKQIQPANTGDFVKHHNSKITVLLNQNIPIDEIYLPSPQDQIEGYKEIVKDLKQNVNIFEQGYINCEPYCYHKLLFQLSQIEDKKYYSDNTIIILLAKSIIKTLDISHLVNKEIIDPITILENLKTPISKDFLQEENLLINPLNLKTMSKKTQEEAQQAQEILDKYSNKEKVGFSNAENHKISGYVINEPKLFEGETKAGKPFKAFNISISTKKDEIVNVVFYNELAEKYANTIKKEDYINTEGTNLKNEAPYFKKDKETGIETTEQVFVKKMDGHKLEPSVHLNTYMTVLADKETKEYLTLNTHKEVEYLNLKGYILTDLKKVEDGKEVSVRVPGTLTLNSKNEIGKEQIENIKKLFSSQQPNPDLNVVNISVKGNARKTINEEGNKHPYYLSFDSLNMQKEASFSIDIDLKAEVKQKLQEKAEKAKSKQQSM